MDRTAKTVGELIKILAEYPEEMKITYDYGLCLEVIERLNDNNEVAELTIS